jgi:peptide/nickel transport system permease protein
MTEPGDGEAPRVERSPPEPEIPPGLMSRTRSRHPIIAFLARRLLTGLATLVVASFLIFLATNALPGNVAEHVLGKNATPQLVKSLDRQLHLNRPLLDRYGSWVGGALQGDLGQSAVALAQGATSAPVSGLIGTPLRNSAVLALLTIVLLIPLSLLIGTAAAVRAGRPVDYAVSYVSLVLGALPEFVLGTFLILIFFSEFHLLQPVALVPPGESPFADLNSLVLPVLTLLGVSLAFSARQVRAGVIETLRQDYVRMARLGGIRESRVLWRYALRNALAPSVQTFAQSIQYLFGGIIVVEALFAYPGIGSLLVQAVSVQDVTEVQAIAIVLAAIYVLVNIIADLIVVLLVPRLRTGLR